MNHNATQDEPCLNSNTRSRHPLNYLYSLIQTVSNRTSRWYWRPLNRGIWSGCETGRTSRRSTACCGSWLNGTEEVGKPQVENVEE
jgi:hypothetical protein